MRGGTRSVIVPGSSASSRLYLRLSGNQFGKQMPPTGALNPEQVVVFKNWIDQGAEWPDALANDVDPPPADAKAHARRCHSRRWAASALPQATSATPSAIRRTVTIAPSAPTRISRHDSGGVSSGKASSLSIMRIVTAQPRACIAAATIGHDGVSVSP